MFVIDSRVLLLRKSVGLDDESEEEVVASKSIKSIIPATLAVPKGRFDGEDEDEEVPVGYFEQIDNPRYTLIVTIDGFRTTGTHRPMKRRISLHQLLSPPLVKREL